jgi:hypothetical protein
MLGCQTGAATAQGFASPEHMAELQIKHMLKEQAEAWNRGDMEAFVSVYAEDATFLSSSGLTQGRDKVLARYQAKYPDAAARGTLSLEIVEIRQATYVFDPPTRTDASVEVRGVSVVARWKLAYEGKDDAEGLTLMVFLPTPDHLWQIVQDASM